MTYVRRRPRSLIALALAGAILLVAATPAEAGKDDQKENSKKVPEVPVAALLPAASALVGGGYYLMARLRTARRSRDADASRSASQSDR